MKIDKFLYVDSTIDEKGSSAILEKATHNSQFCCAFTVVPNLFMALECTEHTHFSAIFVASSDKDTLNTSEFQKILRSVGATTPIIRVLDKFESIPDYVFESTEGDTSIRLLTKPFSDRQLCEIISSTLDQPSEKDEQAMNLHLQDTKALLGFHTLDCFDSSFNALDDPNAPLFLTPANNSRAKIGEERRNIDELLESMVSEYEVKRQRLSSSSNGSSSSEHRLIPTDHSGNKESSSSANSVSTDFDPDTVFQDDDEM